MTKEKLHPLNRAELTRKINELSGLLPHKSQAKFKRIAKEILQYDAVRKLVDKQIVGIDELRYLLPIKSPNLLLSLIKLVSEYDPHSENFREIIRLIDTSVESLSLARKRDRKPKIFIVHGHDDHTKLQLKNYLQNTLKLGKPIILHELPSLGRTIIEKFEEESSDVELAFVLLTPDDKGSSIDAPNAEKRRARQNVIFEMGFFLGKLQRCGRAVLLLHKGEIELPTDISGLIYIDISKGVDAAGEDIRRELAKGI